MAGIYINILGGLVFVLVARLCLRVPFVGKPKERRGHVWGFDNLTYIYIYIYMGLCFFTMSVL